MRRSPFSFAWGPRLRRTIEQASILENRLGKRSNRSAGAVACRCRRKARGTQGSASDLSDRHRRRDGLCDHDAAAALLRGTHGCLRVRGGPADLGLCALPVAGGAGAGPVVRPPWAQAHSADQPGGNTVWLHPSGHGEHPAVDLPGAHNRWSYGGKHLGRTGVYLGQHASAAAHTGVRHHRCGIWCGHADRTGHQRFSGEAQYPYPHLGRGGPVAAEPDYNHRSSAPGEHP